MKRLTLVLMVIILSVVHASAWSGGWGRVYALEVRGDTLAEPLTVTDASIVEELSFWVGPGTEFREFMGPVSHSRSIIDWGRGMAPHRPGGLDTFEVRFLLEPRDNPPVYLVLYEPDPENGTGYINTPSSSGRIVTHGVAGKWMYASDRWNERVGAAIAEYVLTQQ